MKLRAQIYDNYVKKCYFCRASIRIVMSNINYDLVKIKAFVFDVDGVLSPESIPIHPTGEPMRIINTKDGYAMQLAVKQGFLLGIITGAHSEVVEKCYNNLGFHHIYTRSDVKIDRFHDFLAKTGLKAEEVCYVGDDIPDYRIMEEVGLPVCPADAAPEIKAIARYISHKKGGEGVARDVIEQVLKTQGKWMQGNAFAW